MLNAGSKDNATVVIFEANDYDRLGKNDPERKRYGKNVCFFSNLVYRVCLRHDSDRA